MNFKHLFSKSLSADPERLHMAAHSHHLWPDASFDGQVQCWDDAASLADSKWDKVMGEVWPEAQSHVARELGTDRADAVVFAPNTHELLVRLVAAAPCDRPLRILTSSGEFHSARRQFARWAESGDVTIDEVAVEPFDSFTERFVRAAQASSYNLIFVSQLLFNSGRIFDGVDRLASLGKPGGPWVVIDGYHAFMALDRPFGGEAAGSAFYLAGGYKYAMAGEGCAFMHAPPGFGLRPPITGWYAEFDDLSLAPGQVGYAPDGRRFLGATFDPSGLYRFNAVQQMLANEGLTTEAISTHVAALQGQLLAVLADSALGRAVLLNPPNGLARARFLAFRSPDSPKWCDELKKRNIVTDVRGDVLRIGFGLYHDADDIDRFAAVARILR